MTNARRAKVVRVDGARRIGGRATLAIEDPLEIRVDGHPLGITMRTPGDDFDLALGMAITDGRVAPAEVKAMSYCGGDAGEEVTPSAADLSGPYSGDFNVVNVATRSGDGPAVHRNRTAMVNSACGVCGADVIRDLLSDVPQAAAHTTTLSASAVRTIPVTARAAQPGFEATGGMHAAAIFAPDGALQVLREDVGRHNAVDKVIGWAATNDRLPLTDAVLFTSGRIALEIVAKAAIGGVPIVVAVSAPTSLAVALAKQAAVTLIGFARGESFTIYTHPERVV